MNKGALIAKLAGRMGWPKVKAEEVINHLLEDTGIIADALEAGGSVSIPGFGVFETRAVAARTGRNPKTGEPIALPAHRRAVFRPGAALKARVAS